MLILPFFTPPEFCGFIQSSLMLNVWPVSATPASAHAVRPRPAFTYKVLHRRGKVFFVFFVCLFFVLSIKFSVGCLKPFPHLGITGTQAAKRWWCARGILLSLVVVLSSVLSKLKKKKNLLLAIICSTADAFVLDINVIPSCLHIVVF